MKTRYSTLTSLIPTALVLLVSGCAITIQHTFDKPPVVVNNYYQGDGGGLTPNPIPAENNTLSTADLGVGYDIVKADPEYWAKNSVEGVGVRPKVFEFLPNPDPNATIDIPKLNRAAIRRRKPLGVNAETNAQFKWEENMKYVSSATEFQQSHSTSVSAGGGAMGVAFSASTSFGNTQEKTAAKAKTIAYKNGAFRGLKMEIDFNVAQKFTPQFMDAVEQLDSNPASYDAFIRNWGTHFSKVATIGAMCAYELEFNRSDVSTRYESDKKFDAEVSGSMAGVSVEASAGYSEAKKNGIKKATGAENITFVSYGGSGAAINDFPKWTEHAIDNPTMIDAYLVSYDTLLSKEFFPKDKLVNQKNKLFVEARKRHYDKAKEIVDKLPKPSSIQYDQMKPPQSFRISTKYLWVETGYNNDSRNYGGITHIGVYDRANNLIQQEWVDNLNGSNPWYRTLKQGERYTYNKDFTITLQPDQLEGAFVTITGKMTQTWQSGLTEGIKSMGGKTADSVEDGESISLNGMEINNPKVANVTYTHTEPGEGDVVKIYFEVVRTQ